MGAGGLRVPHFNSREARHPIVSSKRTTFPTDVNVFFPTGLVTHLSHDTHSNGLLVVVMNSFLPCFRITVMPHSYLSANPNLLISYCTTTMVPPQ
jgi:hypothetical protein